MRAVLNLRFFLWEKKWEEMQIRWKFFDRWKSRFARRSIFFGERGIARRLTADPEKRQKYLEYRQISRLGSEPSINTWVSFLRDDIRPRRSIEKKTLCVSRGINLFPYSWNLFFSTHWFFIDDIYLLVKFGSVHPVSCNFSPFNGNFVNILFLTYEITGV